MVTIEDSELGTFTGDDERSAIRELRKAHRRQVKLDAERKHKWDLAHNAAGYDAYRIMTGTGNWYVYGPGESYYTRTVRAREYGGFYFRPALPEDIDDGQDWAFSVDRVSGVVMDAGGWIRGLIVEESVGQSPSLFVFAAHGGRLAAVSVQAEFWRVRELENGHKAIVPANPAVCV